MGGIHQDTVTEVRIHIADHLIMKWKHTTPSVGPGSTKANLSTNL